MIVIKSADTILGENEKPRGRTYRQFELPSPQMLKKTTSAVTDWTKDAYHKTKDSASKYSNDISSVIQQKFQSIPKDNGGNSKKDLNSGEIAVDMTLRQGTRRGPCESLKKPTPSKEEYKACIESKKRFIASLKEPGAYPEKSLKEKLEKEEGILQTLEETLKTKFSQNTSPDISCRAVTKLNYQDWQYEKCIAATEKSLQKLKRLGDHDEAQRTEVLLSLYKKLHRDKSTGNKANTCESYITSDEVPVEELKKCIAARKKAIDKIKAWDKTNMKYEKEILDKLEAKLAERSTIFDSMTSMFSQLCSSCPDSTFRQDSRPSKIFKSPGDVPKCEKKEQSKLSDKELDEHIACLDAFTKEIEARENRQKRETTCLQVSKADNAPQSQVDLCIKWKRDKISKYEPKVGKSKIWRDEIEKDKEILHKLESKKK